MIAGDVMTTGFHCLHPADTVGAAIRAFDNAGHTVFGSDPGHAA